MKGSAAWVHRGNTVIYLIVYQKFEVSLVLYNSVIVPDPNRGIDYRNKHPSKPILSDLIP